MFKEFCYYLYEIHTGNESDNNKFFSALIGISFFQGMNILTLWGVLNSLFGIVISNDSIVPVGIFLSVSISIVNYFHLYCKRTEIIRKVEGFTSKREKVGKIVFVIYISTTLFLLFYIMNNFAALSLVIK
jgi:uncharacterized membrane-anchored protein